MRARSAAACPRALALAAFIATTVRAAAALPSETTVAARADGGVDGAGAVSSARRVAGAVENRRSARRPTAASIAAAGARRRRLSEAVVYEQFGDLLASSYSPYTAFGTAVALDDVTAVVGAIEGTDSRFGSAYVIQKENGTWSVVASRAGMKQGARRRLFTTAYRAGRKPRRVVRFRHRRRRHGIHAAFRLRGRDRRRYRGGGRKGRIFPGRHLPLPARHQILVDRAQAYHGHGRRRRLGCRIRRLRRADGRVFGGRRPSWR